MTLQSTWVPNISTTIGEKGEKVNPKHIFVHLFTFSPVHLLELALPRICFWDRQCRFMRTCYCFRTILDKTRLLSERSEKVKRWKGEKVKNNVSPTFSPCHYVRSKTGSCQGSFKNNSICAWSGIVNLRNKSSGMQAREGEKVNRWTNICFLLSPFHLFHLFTFSSLRDRRFICLRVLRFTFAWRCYCSRNIWNSNRL